MEKAFSLILTLKEPGFLPGVALGGWVFSTPSPSPLPLKSDDSNFAQNNFGIRQIFCEKNPDLIDNDVTMTSSLLCSVSKLAKNSLF